MTHRRNPSEGLNIGEGFPTSYSTFAVNADSRAHDSPRSTTQAKRGYSNLKRRTSPPLDAAKAEASPKTHSSVAAQAPSSPKITFDSGTSSPVSTTSLWETTVKAFYKRWKLVVFFLALSVLVVCGTLLPVSRVASLTASQPGSAIKRDNILGKQVRSVRDTAASPQPEHQAVANRFSRWAQAMLGTDETAAQTVHPVPIIAGLGDLEMPDELIMAADPDPDIVLMAEKAIAERRAAKWAARWSKSKKRRNDHEEVDKDMHEHPSRVARRQKLSSTQKSDAEARQKLASKKQVKNGVFERIARAFQADPSRAVAAVQEQENWKTSNKEGNHILDTWGASHPELIDVDGGYAGF